MAQYDRFLAGPRRRHQWTIEQRIIAILQNVSKKDAVPGADESLFDSGYLDSFALPDMVSELEREFDIQDPRFRSESAQVRIHRADRKLHRKQDVDRGLDQGVRSLSARARSHQSGTGRAAQLRTPTGFWMSPASRSGAMRRAGRIRREHGRCRRRPVPGARRDEACRHRHVPGFVRFVRTPLSRPGIHSGAATRCSGACRRSIFPSPARAVCSAWRWPRRSPALMATSWSSPPKKCRPSFRASRWNAASHRYSAMARALA